jgi:tetraacyldisaccharide 4'-kinase
MDPWGSGRVLPAGALREPFANLHRADAILITRSNLVDSTAAISETLRRRNSRAPIFETEFRIATAMLLANFLEGQNDDAALPEKLFAFCGLGNPESFFSQLAAQDHKIEGTLSFADHHRYRQHDILRIEGKARRLGASALITTGKDAVKLTRLEFTMPCFVAAAETVFTDAAGFRDLVLSA